MKKKLFRNPTSYAVLVFVIGAIGMLAYCEDANAELAVEHAHDSTAGISEFNSGLDRLCVRKTFETGSSAVFCPIVAVRGEVNEGSFELGIADRLWGRWEGQITLNQFDGTMYGGGSVRRMIGDGKFKMFIGLTGWINESPGSNSYVTFNLGMRYAF